MIIEKSPRQQSIKGLERKIQNAREEAGRSKKRLALAKVEVESLVEQV
jgi:hypothetical protein